ncbi:MAG: hypothetical protein OHK0015_34650 [Chloroflexi bacterium OHK40]
MSALRVRVAELERALTGRSLLVGVVRRLAGVSSLGERARLLAETIVPALADTCVLYALWEPRPAPLARHRSIPGDSGEDQALDRVVREQLNLADPNFAGLSLGVPLLLSGAEGGPGGAEVAALHRRYGITAHALVPALARGRVIALLNLICGPSGRRYTAHDLELLADLALLAGLLLDHARLQHALDGVQQELRRVVRERDEREAVFRAVADHTELGITVTDAHGALLYANPAFEQLLGYSLAELQQIGVGSRARADELAEEHRLIEELFAGAREYYQFVKQLRRRDGSEAPVQVTGLLVRDAEGVPLRGVALVRDLSAEREAEERQRWLVAILEAMPDPVGYMSLDGTVHYLNRAYRALRRLPDDIAPETISFREWQPAWMREQALNIGVPAAIQHGIWQGEGVIYDAEGREVPVRQTIIALRDRSGAVARLATILHDVSDERQAAQERLALERKLLDAQHLESLGLMAGGIAHDFNNILTSVLGHAELALLSASPDEAARQSLHHVVAGSLRAAELTRQILAYAGKGRFLVQPQDLNQIVTDTGELLRSTLAVPERLSLSLATGLPPVAGDAAQLRQMLAGLIANADEALGPERPDGHISVETAEEQLSAEDLDALLLGAGRRPGRYVRLSVVDNGPGMDDETIRRAFDPFFSTKFMGRGLGLAAVHGIVRAHSGALRVESAPGQGTRFQIWLPATSDAPPE